MFMYIEMSNHQTQNRLRKGIWRWLAGEEDIVVLEMCCLPVCRARRIRRESKA